MKISSALLDQIEQAAKGAFPREACGLLVGRGDEVMDVVASQNLADSCDEFQIDPEVHLKTQRKARGKGLSILGVYHSHPTGDSAPSKRDKEGVNIPGFYWMITGYDGESIPKTAVFLKNSKNFTSQRRQFVKVPLQIENFGV